MQNMTVALTVEIDCCLSEYEVQKRAKGSTYYMTETQPSNTSGIEHPEQTNNIPHVGEPIIVSQSR